MGWKNVKESFNIPDSIIVHVRDGNLILGVPFVPEYYSITPDGIVKLLLSDRLTSKFDSIIADIQANPDKFINAFSTPDTFNSNNSTWTYQGSQIIECQCEVTGFPNVTHDGQLMFENTHFLSFEEAHEKAVKVNQARITNLEERKQIIQSELLVLENELTKLQSEAIELNKTSS